MELVSFVKRMRCPRDLPSMVSTWRRHPCTNIAACKCTPSTPTPPQDAELARSYFKDAPNVEVVEIPIRDGWTRDWGPSVSGRKDVF